MGSSETKHELKDVPGNGETKNVTTVDSKSEIWLPDRLNSVLFELNEDDRKTLFFCRAITAILNRLTPENFSSLSGKIKQLPIDSPDRMQRIVLMIHAKAVRESKFCALYADLCDLLRDVQVVNELGIIKPFYLYLIDHCEMFFQNSLNEDLRFDRHRNETNLLSDEEIRKLSMRAFNRSEYEFRKDSVGNCQFIGELFKVYMIHPEIIFQILDQLLKTHGNMATECACSILTTIGFFYEEKIGEFPADYLNKLKSLLSTDELCPRVRFMIQDVLDLKNNYWRPKRQPEMPKTLQQLDHELIEEEKSRKLSEYMSDLKYVSKQNERNDESSHAFCPLNDWTSISKDFFKYFHNQTSGLTEETPTFEDSVYYVLENLTYDNFNSFSWTLRELPIDDTSRLRFVTDLIFEQVFNKPDSCELYAKLCNGLQSLRVPDEEGDASETTAFKTVVANKCQQLFEDNKTQESEANTDESHRKFVITCRFIGELFKAHVLHVLIVINCVQKLSTSADEKSLECLYELLNIAGKTLSERLHRNKEAYAKLFGKLQSLLDDEQCHLSAEMKSVLEGLLGTEKAIKPKAIHVSDAEELSSANIQTSSSEKLINDEKDVLTEKWSDNLITSQVPNVPQKAEQTVAENLNMNSLNQPQSIYATSSQQNIQKPSNVNPSWKNSLDDAKTTLELYSSFSDVLYKLQHDNLKKSIEKITILPIDNLLRLQGAVNLIFTQAIKKPSNCDLYAQLCSMMKNISVPDEEGGEVTFKLLLINKCQQEFERNKDEELDMASKQTFIQSCSDKKTKRRFRLLFKTSEREFNHKMIAICRFIGELFKQKILVARTIFRCVTKLLEAEDKLSLECLCTLLQIAGKNLEAEVPLCKKKEFESCFVKMQAIAANKKITIKKKIKKMLQNVIISRQNAWVDKKQRTSKAEAGDSESLGKCTSNDGSDAENAVQENTQKMSFAGVQHDSSQTFCDTEENIPIAKSTVRLVTSQNVRSPLPLTTPDLKGSSKEAKATQSVLDSFSSILSKLNREIFVQVIREIAALQIDNSSKLNGVIGIIFAQVIKKTENCDLYAELCSAMQEECFSKELNFRMLLLNKCQQEFERDKDKELEVARQQKIIKSCNNNVAKQQFELLFKRKEFEFNRKSIIISRFIGELFNSEILTAEILFRCINKLSNSSDRLSLVCLCTLLETIGKNVSKLPWNNRVELDSCFKKMQTLVENENSNVSAEIKLMLRDLISLKENGWVTSTPSASEAGTDGFEYFWASNQVELDLEWKNDESNIQKPNESMNEGSCNLRKVKDNYFVPCDGTEADVRTDSSETFTDDEEDILESQLKKHSMNEPQSNIHATSLLQDDLLKSSSNDEKTTEGLLSSFSSLLCRLKRNNKIDNLNELIEKMATLPFDNLPKLQGAIDLIFEEAIQKYKHRNLYVELCRAMQNITVLDGNSGKMQTFRLLLNEKCRQEFEYDEKEELDLAIKRKILESCAEPVRKYERKLFSTSEHEFKQRSRNRYRFICVLCKLRIFPFEIMFFCVTKLLDSPTNESLECVCALLKIVGKQLESELPPSQKDKLNSLYEKFKTVENERKHYGSKKARIMSQEIVTLIENRWVVERPSALSAETDHFETSCASNQKVRECQTVESNSEPKIVAKGEQKTQNLDEPEIEESASSPRELENISYVFAENIAPDISSKPAAISRRKFRAMESFKLLRSAFDQWIPNEIIPQWFELMKETWSPSRIPKAVSELIQCVMKNDPQKADKCGRFFVYLMKHSFITKEDILKGLRSFLNTVENQQISAELDLVLSPMFGSGYLQLDDLNTIFQNNFNLNQNKEVKEETISQNEPALKEHVKNYSQSEEVKKETILQNESASKQHVRNDSSSSQQKIPNVSEQKVVALSVPSFFDPFSSVTSSTTDLTAEIFDGDVTKMRPDQIRLLIRDILQTQTPSNFSSQKFKGQMESIIPFHRAAELEFLTSCIIKMVVNNPDLYKFYARLCFPIMMLVAEKMKFWIMLMITCHNYFHQVLFVEDTKDEQSAELTSIAKNSKKETKKNKLKGFCRFFSLLVNKLNNETANTNVKRAMRKFLEIRKIDFFCEIYDHLNKEEAHFERSLFESYIPELLSSNELGIEYQEMLKRVAEDYAHRQFLRYKSHLWQQEQKTSKKSKKRNRNRGKHVDPNTRPEENVEDGELPQNDTKEQSSCVSNERNTPVGDEKSTVSSSNLDTSLNSSNSSEESEHAEPSTSNSKSSSFQNPLESNASHSKLPTNQSSDTAANAVPNDEKSSTISHKEISDIVVDVLNQLIAPRCIFVDLVHRLTSMPLNRESKLTNVVHQICNRAIRDDAHVQQYVILCEHLQHWSIVDKDTGKSVSFKVQLIVVLYIKRNQIKLKIEEYNQNTESQNEILEELFSRVMGYCRFLCDVSKSPVFSHEILICPVIELLSLDPIDKDSMELLNEFLSILTIDLDSKLMSFKNHWRSFKSVKFSAQELEQHNLLFKITTFLQEMIEFQKCDYKTSNSESTDEGVDPSFYNQNKNGIQSTQELHQISNPKITSRREELESFLKMNPTIVDSIVKRFERITETPEKVLVSILEPMCESFDEKCKKNQKRDINEEFSYAIIFKSIHETIPSFEFLCMNTVFECVKNLNTSSGVMSSVFEFLFLYEIISYESFVRFRNVHVSEKISEVMKLLNSPIFQNYKLGISQSNFQGRNC